MLMVLATAFLVAAVTEETAKWLCARRVYKRKPRSIYAILASACVCALGLATVKNVGSILSAKHLPTASSLWFVVLRDALAFPVHVGTTFYIALVSASAHLDRLTTTLTLNTPAPPTSTPFPEEDSGGGRGSGANAEVVKAWFLAVLFHAWFDVVSLSTLVLIAWKVVPKYFEALVVVVQSISVVLFVLFVRARFNALVQREHAL